MSDLWAALALVMIIEGLMPFALPGIWRQALLRLAATEEKQLRMFGAASMAFGLLMLYFVRGQ